MNSAVAPKVYELLKTIVGNNIDDYSILFHNSNKQGEGYLGEICYVSLKEQSSGKSFDFVIKEALIARNDHPVRDYYLNEIHFYDKVWPAFKKFQSKIPAEKRFDKIAKCFATMSEDLDEKLVLENLKYHNFVLYDKRSTFDKEHIEYIFKQYGRFHAISFTYKILDPQGYSELTRGLKHLWCSLCDLRSFKSYTNFVHQLCLKSLDPEEDAEAIEKYKHYVKDGVNIFYNSNIYQGNYSAVLHGDCWSNNMMFKYDECGKVADVKFLDFQFTNIGTPVYDLSYCLYSGASKEILDELDYYLKIYHDSLSENVKVFGCDPERIYPFEALKRDWKQYSKMGFFIGLTLCKAKFSNRNKEEVKDAGCDENSFKKITRDLIMHMHKNDFL